MAVKTIYLCLLLLASCLVNQGKKSVLDYTEADLDRLYEQWEVRKSRSCSVFGSLTFDQLFSSCRVNAHKYCLLPNMTPLLFLYFCLEVLDMRKYIHVYVIWNDPRTGEKAKIIVHSQENDGDPDGEEEEEDEALKWIPSLDSLQGSK